MNAIIRTTPPGSIALHLYNGKYHSILLIIVIVQGWHTMYGNIGVYI